MSKAYKRNTCRFCGNSDFDRVLELTPTPPADSYVSAEQLKRVQKTYPIDLYLCRNCGMTQLLDVIDTDEVYRHYPYETSSSLGLVKHFENFADEMMRQFRPAPCGLVIDIGSNDGALLKYFKKHGMKVLGIDPTPAIAKKAMEKFGIPTLAEFFTKEYSKQLKKEYGSAAIIACNNLFANIDDPIDFIEGVRELMTPDSVFIFESFYLVDQMENQVWDFTYHEHLCYFTVKPLRDFFNKFGMELIDAQRISTKGGSIRYKVQLKGGLCKVLPTVEECIKLEERVGIQKPQIFKKYSDKIKRGREEFAELIKGLKAQRKTFAAFGASATSTTLMYHYGMGEIVDFIADDFVSKQNLFSPGFHIPVYHPDEIYKRKPDCIIILAWRYYEPIIKKHQRFLDEGGQFIVPLPEIKVISKAQGNKP